MFEPKIYVWFAQSSNKSAPFIKTIKPITKKNIFNNINSSQKKETDSLLDQVSLKYRIFLYSGLKIVLTPYNHYIVVKTTPLPK